MPDAAPLTVIDHPLVQHKLSLMRDRATGTAEFRRLCQEIGMLMAYEVLRDLEMTTVPIETPVAAMQAPMLAGKKLVLAPILRAGLGFCDGILSLVPAARVAHIGLYRDPQSLEAVEYYCKTPDDLAERLVVAIDPMLATGNSAAAAVGRLKERGARDLRLLCLVAAPEGVARFRAAHPDVPVFTAAIDERLNDHGYIVPGLGDAGDRMFGTR
ncbi:MAG: uracil phosphoribosyltransferase [Alphaproteobacteria bacterium]|nr:uracil phosphoribosyltransferase [Alphaproteobacteria bacterium]MCB9930788.1 uracil phosphoribosyltransferase [Alphaproteobacteria bacterium]